MAEHHIGVLAEDLCDCEAVQTLIDRIFSERGIVQGQYKVHRKAGKGCAKLQRKAAPWMAEFAEKGCRRAGGVVLFKPKRA